MRARKRNRHFGKFGLGLVVLGLASCSAAHRPEVSEAEQLTGGWPKTSMPWREQELPILQVSMPTIAKAQMVNDDDLCATCHETYVKLFATNVHREQKCEGCHGPASEHLRTRGKEPGLILSFKTLPPAERSELCLKCHEQQQCEPGIQWRTSVHAHSGVSCTDCHKGHYNVPPGTPATTAPGGAAEASAIQPVSLVQAQAKEKKISLKGTSNNMGAIPPSVCYQCHQETQDLERIAHPHQVLGQNNFNCTTCHDPHGKIKEATRVNLCLDCHKGAPTMAWHSAVHSLNGVACTDCHNPHPKASVARIVNVSHTTVDRPQRLPMSVDEPAACYKCHQEIYGLNSLPSHHPIKEGKMSCSSCHDPHGQALGNLKEASVNLVCYKCHAEKQGPFVWEHPPVTENCGHCHDPHGTVANNLLKQPTTFLCLRCHAGHRKDNRNPDLHLTVRAATFTNCSQCHNQIHGSDIPSNTRRGSFLR